MKKVTGSANIKISVPESEKVDWRDDVTEVAKLVNEATTYMQNIERHSRARDEEHKRVTQYHADLDVLSRRIVRDYPGLDMYLVQKLDGYRYAIKPSEQRYNVVRAQVINDMLDIQIVSEMGVEEEEDL